MADEVYYLHSNHLGSTTLVTCGNNCADSKQPGDEVGRVQYGPFGNILDNTLPDDLIDRLFTGQRWKSSTGLYDYRARFYDPLTGSFIQPDSIVPNPMDPRAWNRFGYVYGNPVNYTDPSGHIPWLAIAVYGGAALLGGGTGGYYAYNQGYGFDSWQLYAYAGIGAGAGVAGAASGALVQAALVPASAGTSKIMVSGMVAGFAGGIGGIFGGVGAVIGRIVRKTRLFNKALDTLDDEIALVSQRMKTQQRKISAMVVGVDIRTGKVASGIKVSGKGITCCAEDLAVEALGVHKKWALLTHAYRPMGKTKIVPVCPVCQDTFSKVQFPRGTLFD